MATVSHPRLRSLEVQWIDHGGRPALLLQDRLRIGARAVVVPQLLAPLLALCDGSRDIPSLRAAMELHTGIRLDMATMERFVSQLDGALLLEGERFAEAHREALESYRASCCRPAILAGGSYPADAAAMAAALERWIEDAAIPPDGQPPFSRLRGIVCPHIDYERGGEIYGRVWGRARDAVAEADLFVLLGTDHAGGPGELTLTRQSYQTPFGILETDVEAVDQVAQAIGPEAAFRSELNHRVEHSIELAAVWLHHLSGGRKVRVLPVLCGSFHPFTQGYGRPMEDERWQAATSALGRIAGSERALVVAAADLAHVGPAFGDAAPVGTLEQARLGSFDTEVLATISRGDAEAFLDLLVREGDRYRVCGLPPIYLALRIMGPVRGEVVGYRQCPAPGDSVVSVAGLLLSAPGDAPPSR